MLINNNLRLNNLVNMDNIIVIKKKEDKLNFSKIDILKMIMSLYKYVFIE